MAEEPRGVFPYEEEDKRELKLKVSFFEVFGLKNCRKWVVEKCFEDIFTATDLHDLEFKLQSGMRNLNNLECFSDCDIDLKLNDQNEVLILVNLKEKGRKFFDIGGSVSTKKVMELSASAGIRNVLGVADKLTLNLSLFGKEKFSVRSGLSVPRPLFFGNNLLANFDIFSRHGIYGTKLLKRVSGIDVSSEVLSNLVFTYDFKHRAIDDMQKVPKNLLPIVSPTKLSSSLMMTYIVNEKVFNVHPAIPTSGFFLRIRNSLHESLFLGDSCYVKSEMGLSLYHLFHKYLNASLELSVGGIYSMFARSGRPGIIDLTERVFTKVRGFEAPQERGTSYVNSCARIAYQLPFLGGIFKATGISAQGFLNAGKTLTGNGDNENVRMNLDVSVGLGLCLYLGIGRVELNFCHPLTKKSPGFQKVELNFHADM